MGTKLKQRSLRTTRTSDNKNEMTSLTVARASRSLSPAPQSQRSCKDRDIAMRERGASISLYPRNFIPICPQLTPSQVSVIRKSWRHINTKGLVCALTRAFQRLELSCPIASKCFSSVSHSLSTSTKSVRSVADHSRFLLALLDKIVDGDQDAEEVREMGAHHVSLAQQFGFSSSEIDKFQEILVEIILKQDGVQQSKETSRAWRLLICSMLDVFRLGFEQQLRQFKRKHSFNAHTQYFDNIERRVSLCPSRKASLNVDPRINSLARKMSEM